MVSRDNSNSQGDKRDRIERLRKRLQDADMQPSVRAILRGILDLLADEL